MPDPADVIADVISRAPYSADLEAGWQHKAVMAMPDGPALARDIADRAVEALAEAGWKIVPGWAPQQSTLPSAGQVRTWLADHGWTPGEPGSAGALWEAPWAGAAVAVPHDSNDADAIAGAIKRIAERESRLAGQVAREMRQCRND